MAFHNRSLGQTSFAALGFRHGERAPLNPEGAAFHQSLGYFAVCCIQNPAKGGPGNVHPLCSLLLIEPYFVGQAKGFQFFLTASQALAVKSQLAQTEFVGAHARVAAL